MKVSTRLFCFTIHYTLLLVLAVHQVRISGQGTRQHTNLPSQRPDVHVIYNTESVDCGIVASMMSVAVHTSALLTFHIVVPSMDVAKYPKLPRNAKIEFHQVPHMKFERRPRQHRMKSSYIPWGRLFIPNYVHESVKKVVYLDTDTLVNADIFDLYLTGQLFPIAAVRENGELKHWLNITIAGVPASAKMFNTGVLLVDTEKWRKLNITARLLDLTYLPYNNDQVLFNVLFHQIGVGELPVHWNIYNMGCAPCKTPEEVRGIYHWSCEKKWWVVGGCNTKLAKQVFSAASFPVECQNTTILDK